MTSTILPKYSVEWGRSPMVEETMWLGEGDFCVCYLVNNAYVFRFAKHARASAAMRIEQCLLPVLHSHLQIAVPDLLFGGRRDDTGYGMLGYPLLAGIPLDAPLLAQQSTSTQTTFIAHIAAFVRQLHKLPLAEVRLCDLPVANLTQHFVKIIDQAQAQIAPRLTDHAWQHYVNALARYLHEPSLHSYRPALLHGDLSPDHILVDIERELVTGVIDFGDACIGDPAWDLIYIYEDYGPDVLRTFLHHYDQRHARQLEQKVKLYQQLNNIEYCLQMLSSGDEEALQESLMILEQQAADDETVFDV